MTFARYCLCFLLFLSGAAFAVDGTVLINQSTALAGLGGCDTPGFPITICQPGSYKLSGNLTVSNDSIDGIDIASDNVTLDLNGFSIKGPRVCSGYGSSISCTGSPNTFPAGISSFSRGTKISNGSISGFDYGIQVSDAATNLAADSIEDMKIYSNGGDGIYFNSSLVRRCTVTNNGYHGIQGYTGTVEDSVSSGNGQAGFALGTASVLKNSSATLNLYGLEGNSTLYGSTNLIGNVLDSVAPFAVDLVSQGDNACGGFFSPYKC